MFRKDFIFDLQRFDSVPTIQILLEDESASDGVSFVRDGEDFIGVNLPSAGKVIVSGDSNFEVNGNELKIKNVDFDNSGDIVVTYNADGEIEMDISALIALDGTVLEVISTGGANKIIPSMNENAIKIGTYSYNYLNNGVNAYFMVDDTTVKGYVLSVANDAINVTKTNEIDVYDEDDITKVLANVSGKNYIVKKLHNGYSVNITESADVVIGDYTFNFTIGTSTKNSTAFLNAGGITIYFDEDGTVNGVQGLDLFGARDSLVVTAPNVTEADGGIALINSSEVVIDGNITSAVVEGYISVSDGDFTLTSDTAGNQKIQVAAGTTVYGVNPKPVSEGGINIINDDSSVIITGGTGNDTIDNIGSSTNINAGKGDDSIINDGQQVTFIYADGDGSDIIEGFNATSTLQIGDGTGTYSKETVGTDIVVTVGDGKITLEGATSLSTVNIAGVESVVSVDPLDIEGSDDADSIKNKLDGATINSYAGNDTIRNTGDNVLIDAGTGDDSIKNSSDFVTIDGGEGVDTISNSGSNVEINGGASNDTIKNTGENVLINAGTGDDLIKNSSDFVTIDGGASNDTIRNTGENVLINAGTGDDLIKNSSDFVTIDGGASNDTIRNTGENVLINAGTGDDSIKNSSDFVTIDGGEGADTISNSGSNVSINGGAGNDELHGGKGNDTLEGGKGADVFVYNNGNDHIVDYSEEDGDKIQIASGTVTSIEAGKEDVVFHVGRGKVTVKNAADQVITYIEGGEEKIYTNKPDTNQIVEYNDAGTSATLTVDYTENSFTPTNYADYASTLVTIDASQVVYNLKIEGNSLDNKITGGTKNDYINGGAGNDSLNGSNGNDTLSGDDGNDILLGGAGVDSLWGGAGNDTLKGDAGDDKLLGDAGKDKLYGGTGNDVLSGGADNDTLYGEDGNDTLAGSSGNDSLFGGAGLDSLSGGNDNDTLDGGAGNDTLLGGAGNDSLSGGAAKDKLDGGAGNDTLWGGAGSDTLYGGAGNDVFIYRLGEAGTDTIFDYQSGDMLQILKADGSSGASYSYSSSFASGKLTLNITGSGSIVFNGMSNGNKININGTIHTISGKRLK